MGELLKEAIADAKAIRATALANAKMALEEAFAPRLQKMISDKIQYEVDGEEGEEDAIDAPADEVPVAEPAPEEVPTEEPAPEEVPAEVSDEEPAPEVEVPAEDGEDEDGEEGMLEVAKAATKDAFQDPEKAKGKNPSVPGGKEDWKPVKEGEEEDDEEDLDLESIIKELEADAEEDDEEAVDEKIQTYPSYRKSLPSASPTEGKEEEDDEEQVDEKIQKFPSYKKHLPKGSPTEGKEEDDEEDDEEENEVVQFGGKATSDAGADPEGVKGKNASVPGGKEDMKPVMESDEEEVDLDEILAELESEEDEMSAMEEPGDAQKIDTLKSELANVNASLSEHKKVVALLKSKLSEVNLLNSKLLFTNKLFKSHNLNNSQKMKVIENFDRAKNLREVKLLYVTISESFSQTELVKKSKPTMKKITEGLASKTSASTKPAVQKVVKQSSIIDDGSAARLRKLAGIIK